MPSLPIQPSRIGRWTQFVIVGIVIVVVIGWWYFCWKPQHTSILLVRHADKVANQDALTPAGEMRAGKLVHVAGKAGITAIYHSDTNRTRRTAEDLANRLGITPIEIPAANAQQLINAIRSNHQGRNCIHCRAQQHGAPDHRRTRRKSDARPASR